MHSVLIQNQSAMESFQHFHPLFLDAINEGKISTCQWMEAGELIETAVPELYQVIDGKEEWRAIIVRVGEEADDPVHPTVQGNPYDYLENSEPDVFIRETPIPLIRLTRMLGGVPTPPIHFETKRIDEPNKAPRVIYEPTIDKEEQADYKRLCEKYHFNGVPPTEIILVSLAFKHEAQDEEVEKAWKNDREINSSEFWKRNGYPSSCRFMVYSMERQGERQREADLFRAWISILLLATNVIDSSALQAYRLHRINVELDKKEMQEVFQKTVNRAKSAKQFIRKSIEHELAEKLKESPDLPYYELEAPVVINLPKKSELIANTSAFGIVSKSSTSDFSKWNQMKTDAEKQLDNAMTSADRALDHTADKVRAYCQYTDAEVKPLDNYQNEDMDRELHRTYESILTLRNELPSKNSTLNKKLAELDRNVKSLIQKHVTKEYAILSFSTVAGLLVLSFISALVYNIKYGWGSKEIMGYFLVIGLVSLLLTELLSLIAFQHKLRKRIDEFNKFIKSIVTHISENGSRYSRYMTNIVTYAHGSSYLSILRKKIFLRDESEFYKRNHLVALDAFILKIETWSTSFHLGVDFEMEELNEGLTINTNISPYQNSIYTFDDPGTFQAEINCSGDCVDSNFSFVKRLNIVREELYDGDE